MANVSFNSFIRFFPINPLISPAVGADFPVNVFNEDSCQLVPLPCAGADRTFFPAKICFFDQLIFRPFHMPFDQRKQK